MKKIMIINISGRDRPGLTAALTEILGRYKTDVLDIGQAVIHRHLSLGIMVHLPEGCDEAALERELADQAGKFGVDLTHRPVEDDVYEKWVARQGKPRRIITLLGRHISAEHISLVSKLVSDQGLNIDVITRLSGRISFKKTNVKPRAAIQLSVTGHPIEPDAIRSKLSEIAGETGIDIAIHMDDAYRRNRRLVVFDMDSTLIQAEVIDELAKHAGVGDEVAAITESAMRGEIDFSESFRRRVALLKGLDESVLRNIAETLPLTEGLERLTSTLNNLGYKTAILSGGFTYFGNYLKDRFGFDYVYANELEIENGKVTGRVIPPIVDGQRKADLLREIAKKEGLQLQQTIAVGDGANDLPMIKLAGLGVAFHAKPIVRERAKNSISTLGLDSLLYLIGIRDREVLSTDA